MKKNCRSPPPVAKNFVTGMLTRDPFAVANLLVVLATSVVYNWLCECQGNEHGQLRRPCCKCSSFMTATDRLLSTAMTQSTLITSCLAGVTMAGM